ncbi:MAG TPA: acetyltransferase [Bacteroidia bacterium]|jgi:sugar O-acyltransferase (sialic acid O-acetyltransferase NeuD family)
MNRNIALIGYSGHAYVVFDIFFSQGMTVSAYTEVEEKNENPFVLSYLGNESEPSVLEKLKAYNYFVALGDNQARRRVSEYLVANIGNPETALHKTAIISRSMNAGSGVMIAPRAVINAKAVIGNGTIVNTGCIVEHECTIGDYAHIAPGAILCGNVKIGHGTLIGAGAVVLPGITIGNNSIIGAGAVVTKNIGDNIKTMGNPSRQI